MEIKNPSMHNVEKKSLTIQNLFSDSSGLGFYLSSNVAYFLFGISDAIGDSVDRIADAFTQIKPQLQEISTGEYILDHPVLELLKNPDERFYGKQLLREICVSYCLTNEFFPALNGNVKYEPVSLFHYPANNVSITQATDGYISTILASYQNVNKIYNRDVNPKYRHYIFNTEDKLSQVAHILSMRKRNYLRAQSPLERVYFQAVTKYYGHVHNSGLLKNASRPSGLWKPKDGVLSQVQFDAFKKEVRDNFSDAINAGKNIIAPQAIEYQNLLLNPRDMDFLNLIESASIDVYNQYKIPLPLVTQKTMTMNNFTKAVEAFFDFAVLPTATFIWGELGSFLLSRYKDGDKFQFVIDERQLWSLKERMFNRAKDMRAVGSYSEDEIRSETGYESIGVGGNAIWKQANLTITSDTDDWTMSNIVYEGQLQDAGEEENNNENNKPQKPDTQGNTGQDDTENQNENTNIIEDDENDDLNTGQEGE